MQTAMAAYKLVYFNARGRAETSRFIFAHAGVEYEDVRVSPEEWSELKPSTLTGKLPLLEVDGRQIPGTIPMIRYLGEKFNLAGSNEFENAIIAGIVDVVEDFRKKLTPLYYEKDEERKAELLRNLTNEDIPNYWGVIENMIKTNNSDAGWVFGDKPTYADFFICTTLEYAIKIYPEFGSKFPAIFKLKDAIEALPNIARWLKERPNSEL